MKGKSQVNIWCWPIGSGEVYGYRMDEKMPAERPRGGDARRHQADKPVGEWNSFEITLKGDRLTVVLNGMTVIENAELPGIPAAGPDRLAAPRRLPGRQVHSARPASSSSATSGSSGWIDRMPPREPGIPPRDRRGTRAVRAQ